jgi:hypothetical protein
LDPLTFHRFVVELAGLIILQTLQDTLLLCRPHISRVSASFSVSITLASATMSPSFNQACFSNSTFYSTECITLVDSLTVGFTSCPMPVVAHEPVNMSGGVRISTLRDLVNEALQIVEEDDFGMSTYSVPSHAAMYGSTDGRPKQ